MFKRGLIAYIAIHLTTEKVQFQPEISDYEQSTFRTSKIIIKPTCINVWIATLLDLIFHRFQMTSKTKSMLKSA